ncbi:MAG: hypothetical protein OXF08_08385 [Bacteroidetes bacterium]|nr:hypothetical protein [Bacteroidota bacterium]
MKHPNQNNKQKDQQQSTPSFDDLLDKPVPDECFKGMTYRQAFDELLKDRKTKINKSQY